MNITKSHHSHVWEKLKTGASPFNICVNLTFCDRPVANFFSSIFDSVGILFSGASFRGIVNRFKRYFSRYIYETDSPEQRATRTGTNWLQRIRERKFVSRTKGATAAGKTPRRNRGADNEI
jgi:hypothetical protein